MRNPGAFYGRRMTLWQIRVASNERTPNHFTEEDWSRPNHRSLQMPTPCLKTAKMLGKTNSNISRCRFSKIWPAGGSTPASTLLENCKKLRKVINQNQEGVIFQKSDPPEAAPLLDPCLKIAKSLENHRPKIPEASFFKNLTRQRQHPC